MKTIIIMKSILKKAIILIGFYCLSILPVLANVSNPEEGWNSPPPADMSTVSSTGEKTVLDQTHAELKPFEDAETSQSQLLRAAPGDGTGQKEVVPVSEGIWIIIGLVIAYGIACRKPRKETQKKK